MDIAVFMQTDMFNWVVMPLIIFFARIIDISLGTVRVIMITKGLRKYAPIVGFFEVLVWLVVVRQVLTSMNNFLWMISYAGGFAAGTYIGMIISDKLHLGHVLVRFITKRDCSTLLDALKKKGYRYTLSYGTDSGQETSILYIVVPTRNVREVGEIIQKTHSQAFYTIEDIRKVNEGKIEEPRKATHNVLFPFRREGK